MARNTTSTKQSVPTTKYGRLIAYDRDVFIGICRRLLAGEDLRAICSTPPMPIQPMFLGWVQDHQEAREIYRSVSNFQSDQILAKELGLPAATSASEWEEQVRDNIQRGWPADYMDRKYIPPDWCKVYPSLGDPPVWSTENRQAFDDLINNFTLMLEPRDLMELIWVKEATDATWELGRYAREKNGLPERRQAMAVKGTVEAQKPATALDYSRHLEVRFKYYQHLDVAQTRVIKRRDNALRQIERWRDGLGAKARALSDKFVAEQLLAERYGATQFLADAETDVTASERVVRLAPVGKAAAETAPAVPPLDDAAEVPGPLSTPEPVPPPASADEDCWNDE
jgi:hypothetical protein